MVKYLSLLKPNDKIIINCPPGFDMVITPELRISDYPCRCEIISNDIEIKNLWIRFKFKEEKVLMVLSYDSNELRNYLLFNIYSADFKEDSDKKPLSKEELKKELQKAIDTGNFESASIINETLKNINE
jgi:hypothetical protein